MNANRTVSMKAADIYLNDLRSRDPLAYRIITARLSGNSMAALGQGETASDDSIWDSITSGISDLLNTGTQYYIDQEKAKAAAAREAQAAANALAQAQAQAALAQAQAQSDAERVRLAKEIAAAEARKIEAQQAAGTKRWITIGVLGFLGLLAWSAFS